MMDSGDENAVLSHRTTGAADQPHLIAEHQAGRAVLATRLLVGLLVSGSGELPWRVDDPQAQRCSILMG